MYSNYPYYSISKAFEISKVIALDIFCLLSNTSLNLCVKICKKSAVNFEERISKCLLSRSLFLLCLPTIIFMVINLKLLLM